MEVFSRELHKQVKVFKHAHTTDIKLILSRDLFTKHWLVMNNRKKIVSTIIHMLNKKQKNICMTSKDHVKETQEIQNNQEYQVQ
jgi:hypothetical protein